MYSKLSSGLAALFVSLVIYVLGAIMLVNSFSLDGEAVYSTLIRLILPSFALGFLGFRIGKILDCSSVKK
ncbi:MAG: hypothetical protein PHV37_09380 [Candidatus Gastranaerophilales bacterium]|nr:hypothetical protein [Candidatus Gastranaerophilales bacterium]